MLFEIQEVSSNTRYTKRVVERLPLRVQGLTDRSYLSETCPERADEALCKYHVFSPLIKVYYN
jgi:hypothetical protein